MKKFIYTILAITAVACGSKEKSINDIIAEGDIKQIKEQRSVVVANLKLLDDALVELDTIKKLALVSTHKPVPTLFNHFVEIQGNVETKQNLILYPEMGGQLKSILVKEGQKVTKGQVLAIIDDSGLKEQIAQTEASAALAKTTFERQERLWAQKIGSEIQFLQAKTTYEAQSKAVEQLKVQLSKTNVTAPFAGVIDDIITEAGSFVAPGQTPITRLINLNNMTISAEIPETFVRFVDEGKKVKAFFPVLDKETETVITQAGNFINPNNRKFKIEMEVPKGINAKPNMTVRLLVNDYKSENAILIPQSILSENEKNEEYVYVAVKEGNNYVAHKNFVKTGKTDKNDIEVLEGLTADSLVIIEGARTIREGQHVKILNK
ncbi:efflux RND transporter periplasmic adaptor subunit [Wenyingzhuangia aestuarii]|uniref:efflux RND transporter periplasmic adaptor subunit n=1 Tax=Wenyingzhuangia aestuarii TaxID=1647582 RepID=UPI00143CA6FB|nr:efflux RND transporter periplasmic adaptor subunit [Wenyingzhuangia aestuarii]NJB83151.1 RND family efflux transporter MFP subunit [Wenyingzhuangia aestuarii]